MKLYIIFLSLFACLKIHAGVLLKDLPDHIDPTANYVFYSHGYIVEGENTSPIHPRWGIYDYPAVLSALTSLDAFIIAEHRKAKTPPSEHAKKLSAQAKALMKNGVPPQNITFIGFSRGGFITAITSSYLANSKISYAILAACTSSMASHETVNIQGELLSIYETSDSVGSCDDVVERNRATISSYKEISISTGQEHGAFYRPMDEWTKPLFSWIARKRSKLAPK